MPNALMDDHALLAAVQERQQDALMTLYHRYGGSVYGMALRITGQPASAEEVTQDVFLKIWLQPHRWNPSLGRFTSWLLTTTRNAAIDRVRGERRRIALDLSEYENDNSLAEPSRFDDPIWADGQELRRMMAQLPEEQRELVELAFFAGYTHSELAEVTGLPLGTVKTRLRTALHRLREMMENERTR